MYVSLNGKLISSNEALVSAKGEGFNYGYGLFETMKIVNGNICFMEEHFNRLKKGCNELNLKLEYSLYTLGEYANELISACNMMSGSIKILYAKDNDKYNLLMTTNKNKYTLDKYKKGFSICIASSKRNPYSKLTYIKSNNYLDNLLEKDIANNNGYDEAVFLNTNDDLSEGTYTNIFFVRGSYLYTPSISCGILPGIMRDKVVYLADMLKMKIEIGQFNIDDIFKAREIFLTNSLMEIMPVWKLENKKFDLTNNIATQLLMKEYNRFYHEQNSEK